MARVLILLTFTERVRLRYYNSLRASFPGLTIDLVDHRGKVDPYIADADVLITFGPMLRDDSVVARAVNLKWVQAMGTGVDGIVDLPSLRPDVLVTNIVGIHGAAVSEAALSAMLALSRDLPRAIRSQDRRAWERWPARLIDGKTVGIFGLGLIAEALAPRLKALGMRVIGISSTPREVSGFDRVHGRDELLAVMPELDYLVLLTPYSPATRNIIGEAVLAAMKPTSYLVNLARGGVVDEPALISALVGGRLAGAALDVFAIEPLPQESPLWAMENVIITTHQGGFYEEYPDHALPVIAANMRCFLAGDRANMINVVKR